MRASSPLGLFLASGTNAGALYLVDDQGDAGGPYAGMVLPGSSVIQNSQCLISGSGSSVSTNSNTLTLTLAVTFKSPFAGNKVVYMAARDLAQHNSDWQALGTFGVPGPAITVSEPDPPRAFAKVVLLVLFTFRTDPLVKVTGPVKVMLLLPPIVLGVMAPTVIKLLSETSTLA